MSSKKEILINGIYTYKIDVRRILGKGAFSTVHSGINISTNEKIAIKKIFLNKLSNQELDLIDREVRIVTSLIEKNNPYDNIVKYYDVIRNNSYVYIVMDLYTDGTFSSLLVKPMKEKYSRYYFKQILDALQALKNMEIIHRDIKPDNILIANDYKKIKICDFGFSQLLNDKDSNNTIICGSPIYMAPELWLNKIVLHDHNKINYTKCNNKYNQSTLWSTESNIGSTESNLRTTESNLRTTESNIGSTESNIGSTESNLKEAPKSNLVSSDLWAAGLILYEMVFGYHPCKGLKDIESIKNTITSVKIIDNGLIDIDKDGLQLLKDILNSDSLSRITIDYVVQHKWLKNIATINSIVLSDVFYNSNKHFKTQSSHLTQYNKFNPLTNYTNKIVNNGSFDDIVKKNNKLTKYSDSNFCNLDDKNNSFCIFGIE